MAQHVRPLRRARMRNAGIGAIVLSVLTTVFGITAPAYADDVPPEETVIVEEDTSTPEETVTVPEEDTSTPDEITTVPAESFSVLSRPSGGEEETVKKVFVCKYVGTPGVDETLQTGQNPISVSVNAIPAWDGTIPSYFADAQGRSYVIAEDTGQPEPECPDGDTPPPTDDPTGTVYIVCTLEDGLELDWEGTAGSEPTTFSATLDDDNDGTFEEQNAELTPAEGAYLYSMLADPTVLTEGTTFSMQIFAGETLLEEKEFTVDCEEDTPPPPPPGEDPPGDPVDELALTGDEYIGWLALSLVLGLGGLALLMVSRRQSGTVNTVA